MSYFTITPTMTMTLTTAKPIHKRAYPMIECWAPLPMIECWAPLPMIECWPLKEIPCFPASSTNSIELKEIPCWMP